jgi:hypothetical protein
MTRAVFLMALLALAGCAPGFQHRSGVAMPAYTRYARIDDGVKQWEVVYLWCDGHWWEVFRREVTGKETCNKETKE